MNRQEIKLLAKEQIKGNIFMYFVASLIVSVIIGAISTLGANGSIVGSRITTNISLSSIADVIVAPVLMMGLTYIALDIRNGLGVKIERVFNGFYDFVRVWCTNFLVGLFTILWTLLFIIPGIVKGLGYSMAPYIIAENKDVSATEAIKKSTAMMYGHKWELFVLHLSFIGWYLLVPLTLGLIFIYLSPYIKLAEVNFYDRIKGGENNGEGIN